MTVTDFNLTAAREAFLGLREAIDCVVPIAKRIEDGELSSDMPAVARDHVRALGAYLMHTNGLADVLERVRLMVGAVDAELQIRDVTEAASAQAKYGPT